MSGGRSHSRSICAALACVVGLHVTAAHANSCTRSLDYILTSASENMRSSQLYRQLYKSCLQTVQLSNVKDAFVLRSGAIAVLPRNNSVPATAGTLAQFCTRFPKLTLRFITPREVRLANNIARVVQLSSSQSTPCQKISGGG
jgi:hypothetical protein